MVANWFPRRHFVNTCHDTLRPSLINHPYVSLVPTILVNMINGKLDNAPTPEGFTIRTPPAASLDVAVQPLVSSDLVSRSQFTSVRGTPQIQTVDMSLMEPQYNVDLDIQNDNIDLLWQSSYIEAPPQLQQPFTVVNDTANHCRI